jgi:hypothetical protein
MKWRIGKRGFTWGAGAALLIAMLPLSCGSGQDSEANVIPRAQFLAKARQICIKGGAKMDKYYFSRIPRSRKAADPEEFLNRVDEEIVIPVKTQQVKELRALGLPEGKEKKFKEFLAAMEEGIEEGKRDRRTLRSSGHYAFQRAFDMAGAVGMKRCFLG